MLNGGTKLLTVALLAIMLCSSANAVSPIVDVPSTLWKTLNAEEKSKLLAEVEVRIVEAPFGIVMDAQSINTSTAATTAGSSLGAALGGATYVDSAFRGNGNNYSAVNHLGAMVLGGMIGSSVDTPAQASFRTRYTIKLPDNEIRYVEEITSTPFRHSVGLCILLDPIRTAPQNLCSMTKESLLAVASDPAIWKQAVSPTSSIAAPSSQVKCKVGNNGPTFLDATICTQLSGTVVR